MLGESQVRLRILLVEDNSIDLRVAQQLLKKLGYTSVEPAANGAEAVRLVERQEFDVILMDVQMPEMNGYEATQRIRAQEVASGRHTPIIALTAHAMKGDRESCLSAGMDDYLSKPIQQRELAAILERSSMAAGPLSEEVPADHSV